MFSGTDSSVVRGAASGAVGRGFALWSRYKGVVKCISGFRNWSSALLNRLSLDMSAMFVTYILPD